MKKIVNIIIRMPKWYGIGIVLLYSFALAEFYAALIRISIPAELVGNSILTALSSLSYSLNVASNVVIWLIMAFLFHLTALLLGGHSTFGRFALAVAYPYLVPAIAVVASIVLLDDLQVPPNENAAEFLAHHPTFKLIMNLLNYSFLPYYLACIVLIHYFYEIKYLYALLSIAIPIGAVWLVTQLVSWL
jgi:hypothetical protein